MTAECPLAPLSNTLLVTLLLGTVLLANPHVSHAATLDVRDGVLWGAFGVDVAGTPYDVAFVDGSCISVFDGCDADSDFAFNSEVLAAEAAQALLDQVLHEPAGTAFDEMPGLIAGCSGPLEHVCTIITPYDFFIFDDPPYRFHSAQTFNAGVLDPAQQADRVEIFSSRFDLSTSYDPSFLEGVYAVWQVVPEPSSALLMGMGLLWLAGRRESSRVLWQAQRNESSLKVGL